MVDELREHVMNNPKFSFKNGKDDLVILYEDEKEKEAGGDDGNGDGSHVEVEVSLEIELEKESVDLQPVEQTENALSGRSPMNSN